MDQSARPGLGELLRHLVELTDGGGDTIYASLSTPYRARYTPIMRALERGPASVSQLQGDLSITQGAISQTIKLMLSDGLITKHESSDARQTVVGLSSTGERLLEDLNPRWNAMFTAIESLENELQMPLRRHLGRAVDALQERSFENRISESVASGDHRADRDVTTNHFDNNGERYAKFRPDYPAALVRSLSELTAGRDLALDVGCGNGQMTALFAPNFKHVIGTDPSASQLNHAEAVANASYLQQSAEEIDLPNNSVDLIVAAQAAHWFDLERFYSEVRRVTKPEAALALVSYGVPCILDPVNAVFQGAYWQDLHDFWPPERAHVETGYAALYFPFTAIDLPQHSCRMTLSVEQFIGYITTWSAYSKAATAGAENQFERFFDELRAAWPSDAAKEVVWPIAVKAATGPL